MLKILYFGHFLKQFSILAQWKSPRKDFDWSCLGHMTFAKPVTMPEEMVYSDWLGLDHVLIL